MAGKILIFGATGSVGSSLAKLLNLDYSSAVIGISKDSKLIASRPNNMVLGVDKLQKVFKVEAPTMAETLLHLSKDYL